MHPLSKNDKGRSPMGPTKILIFGESESTAKIHMSYAVTNRIEPSLARRRGVEQW